MNIFFEESGCFKAAIILTRHSNIFYVQLPSGRRTKIREKDVLIEFDKPSASELMKLAYESARKIDLDFLWECVPDEEFSSLVFADEYFGPSCSLVDRIALILRLHSSPVYFRRKGRHGKYQRVSKQQLNMALKSLENRRNQATIQAQYEAELKRRKLPKAFESKSIMLLTRPDKQSIEYKALEAASCALNVSPARLIIDCGGIESALTLHNARFLSEFFPHGTDFPAISIRPLPDNLPRSNVNAFSIDDITTTEIDDAFSVKYLLNGYVRIGIHIAAPAFGIEREDEIDTIARERLSTVYVPGDKIRMLPDAIVEAFTLREGHYKPVLSLYIIVDRDTQEIIANETLAEYIFVKSNLHYNTLDKLATEEALLNGSGNYPHKDEIAILWPFAQSLFEKRQKARELYGLNREVQRNIDFNFYVNGEHVTITPRRRGSPLDLIVSEMAILTNSTWGALLHSHMVPGIYRTQRTFREGKAGSIQKRTRMQTTAEPHEGLGVSQYAWSTSPLRRYVDLVNQWQLLACIKHGVSSRLVAPFKPKDSDLYAVVHGFDDAYSGYIDYQRRMEYFWCLRWIRQEGRKKVTANVIKGDLVSLDEVPLLLHVPEISMSMYERGTRVLLEVTSIDEIMIEASARFLHVIDGPQEKSIDNSKRIYKSEDSDSHTNLVTDSENINAVVDLLET
ncbi:MAG: RNB domain-containing ribonuclease [Burkholderia sp.]|nr:RNB domain-containing ribonuclease [Burkholderia sp.]